MEGKRFGRLTVVSQAEKCARTRKWLCLCDCGMTTTATTAHLNSGHTKSCGCLAHDALVDRNFVHGHTTGRKFTPEYYSWAGMITRCYNPSAKAYKTHGSLGITVCARWRSSFEKFLLDMGQRPKGTSIDRINNKRGYSPKNCRWATSVEQARNRHNTIHATVYGVTKPLMEWCEIHNLKRCTVRSKVDSTGCSYGRAVEILLEKRNGDTRRQGKSESIGTPEEIRRLL